ncbi:c-Myc-binding protein homolog [Drosophila grimshawi]|uniref:GH13886 n=1 Tax=Drosophila grimshawi TaxID=7222 RepID=B4JTP5_DROGR|nr:c-Myc-binding protein homolog [Drosophila grimshawi]EDV91474.1 GH13886 [Drosophila grimshawi]
MSFKPIELKRDEIRRYLERGSVLDALTKVFVRVIKERPENPMEYIRNNIGVVRHQHDKYERLAQDLQEANEEIKRLRAIINVINPDVLQPTGESDDSEPVTVAEQLETSVTSASTQETNQNLAAANGVDNTPVDAKLTVMLDNCRIEENNMAAEPNIDNTNKQSSSVQAEPSSTDTE